MENHILVVDNEPKIAGILRDYLASEGFSVSILNRGDKVVSFVKTNQLVMVLLDIMIPHKDGLSVCKEIRTFSDVPIIMITARVDEIDRILGLELGADDYICKPFSPREVVARVKTVLRRLQLIEQVQGYSYDGYDRTIDFHIKNLRKKISACLPDKKIIHSIYGFGYKLVHE